MPAPDVNTNEQIMAWMMDTYSMHVGHTDDGRRHRQAGRDGRLARPPRSDRPRRDDRRARSRPSTSASTSRARRSPCRASATSARSRRELLAEHRRADRRRHRLEGRRLQRQGPRHREARSTTSAQHKTVDGFPGGEPLTNDELFALDVDILIPAALENQITDGERADDSRPRSSSKAPTARRRRTRTSTCTSAASSSCPTSSPTAAASPRRTSSGCRTATATSGPRRK